jgi:phosphatidylglycerol lysyltransferase
MVRSGYTTEAFQPPLTQKLIDELREISNEWLTQVHGTEKRFSVGWFEDEYIRGCHVMLVRSPDGIATAFANVLPEYQRNESTVDMMRQRPEGEYGTMEFMFVSLLQWAKNQGYRAFNLGLSALSGIGRSADGPAIEKALKYIYDHVNQFYNFRGLHNFKEKFHPEWSPRYLVYPGRAALPQVALAVINANSGNNPGIDYLKELLKEYNPLNKQKKNIHP